MFFGGGDAKDDEAEGNKVVGTDVDVMEWEVEREDDWEDGKVEEREELLLSPILNVVYLTTRGNMLHM